jgi:hypothetical protein
MQEGATPAHITDYRIVPTVTADPATPFTK